MSYEEEFDKIIRQKAGEADYPFDESNWEKTSRMIDAERALGRKAFWKKLYLPGAVIVATGVAGVIAFNYFTKGDSFAARNEVAAHQISTQRSPEQRSFDVTIAEQKVSSANDQAKIKNETTSVENTTLNSPNLVSDNKKSAIINPSKKGSDKAKNDFANNRLNNTQKKSETGNSVLNKKVTNPDNKKSSDEGLNSGEINARNDQAGIENKKEYDFSGGASGSENKSNSGIEMPSGNMPDNDGSGSQVQSAPLAATATENEDRSGEETIADIMTPKSFLYMPNIDMSELAPASLVVLSRYDDDYVRQLIRHYVNLEGGGTYLLGWQTAKGTDAAGLNWFGGINYRYQLCDKTSFGLGFQVSRIANISQPFHSTYKTEYGFGSSKTYTEITAKELYYFSIPVRLNYHLNRSNYFGFGVNAGYLISAKNETSTFSATDAKPLSTSSSTEVFENLNTTNFMGSVYYNVSLTDRLSLNAEFIYGLSDLFKNTAFNKYSEKPVGLRLGLQFDIFKR